MALQAPEAIKLKSVLESLTEPAELCETEADGRIHCYACGHDCRVAEGKAGVCRVRFNEGGVLRAPSGYVGGLQCDPIAKKPFFHAFPGRDALSFGMLGCDLHCSYCQNWVTSQTLRDDRAVSNVYRVTADELAEMAVRQNAPVITSTYNEPLITSEWAVEVFKAAAERGLVCSYVSNGNANQRVLEYLRPHVQLYKVDLKSFDDKHYRSLGGQLANVLRTIEQLHEMGFWLEIVTLVIPGFNDSDEELRKMAGFLAGISRDIPWHVTGFHADYKMDDVGGTSVETLVRAHAIGREAGLRYVYAGNRPGEVGDRENTFCPGCGATLISRHGFMVYANRLEGGRCPECETAIPGFWDKQTVVLQEGMGEPAWLGRF